MNLQGEYWMPWALAGILIVVMLLYKLEMHRRNKRRK